MGGLGRGERGGRGTLALRLNFGGILVDFWDGVVTWYEVLKEVLGINVN